MKALKGFVCWDGYWYCFKVLKKGNKYYKSKNVRFDETCGGTEECSEREYIEAAKKYAEEIGK